MECIYKGGPDQTEYLGGRCVDGQVKGGIGIPGLDSFLVGFSKNTDVTGLNQIPKNDQPPAKTMLHLSLRHHGGDRHPALPARRLVRDHLVAEAGPAGNTNGSCGRRDRGGRGGGRAGCGWIVTEVGRQPWIVNGYMRTSQAVTPAQGIWWVFGITLAIYAALGVIAIVVLRALSRRWQAGQDEEGELPYSPPSAAKAPGASA